MRLLLALLLLVPFGARAAFTEFYCIKGTGTNVNSGHTQDANPTFTADSGNWTNATWTFFKTGLNPVAGGVTNGAWASICTNLTSTNAWLVAMVTSANDTTDTIQLDSGKFMGVNPADRVGDVVIRIGGAWAGPNTNTMTQGGGFPFAFMAGTAASDSVSPPRCNIKSGTVYGISNAITHAVAGPVRFQGYTTTPGDGGRASIDGGTTKPGYTLLTITGSTIDMVDLEFSNNGASGSGSLVFTQTGARHFFLRCVFHDSRSAGLYAGSSGAVVQECEAYSCVKDNVASAGGFKTDVFGAVFDRCVSHDHTTANGHGFGFTSAILLNCVSESNTGCGAHQSGSGTSVLIGSSFYSNNLSGFDANAGTDSLLAENCSFLKNSAYGINATAAGLKSGQVINCAFGTGTMTNSSGSFAVNATAISTNSIILLPADTTPWVDPANGNFTINSSSVKSLGRGAYTQTQSGYTGGTVAYPDIGAAQSASTNTSTRATSFSQ